MEEDDSRVTLLEVAVVAGVCAAIFDSWLIAMFDFGSPIVAVFGIFAGSVLIWSLARLSNTRDNSKRPPDAP